MIIVISEGRVNPSLKGARSLRIYYGLRLIFGHDPSYSGVYII